MSEEQGALRAALGWGAACTRSWRRRRWPRSTRGAPRTAATPTPTIATRSRRAIASRRSGCSHTSLSSYERFTPQDPAAIGALQRRGSSGGSQSLREVNAPRRGARAADAAPSAGHAARSRPGGESAPQIEVPMTAPRRRRRWWSSRCLSKRTGDIRTRRTTVVRQGDRVITVILGPAARSSIR